MNISKLASIVYPFLQNPIAHISSMPLATRSILIKCCQAQTVPTNPLTTLGHMIHALPPYYMSSPHGTGLMDPKHTFPQLQGWIAGPVTSSIILDLCRSLPVSNFEMDEARIKSWQKEAVKIEESERPCKINWEPIFDPSRAHEPMLPFLPSNRPMSMYLCSSLLRWRRKISDSILYPRSTNKNMSRATRREFEAETGISLENVPIFSQEDWLRYKHRTGIELAGATEMRQKWYPSGAKPRTYFAQGGEHYAKSAELQDVFSELVNCCPVTNHVTRLQPSRLVRRVGEHYRVYDLSTFTSNMAEQRGFVKRLAEFCYGTTVYRFDVAVGIIKEDLGDMMTRYYESCVYHPSVSYERVPGVVQDLAETFLSDHGVASMLGIFGNLMTCTFAHGAVMLQTVETEEELNVAGDDGLVREFEENKQEIEWCIGALGECEMSKTFRTDEDGAICLKRPITHSLGGLELGSACIPPSLTTTLYYLYGVSDARYTFFSDAPKTNDGFSIVGKDWMRFLRSVYRIKWKLDETQIEIALLSFRKLTNLAIGQTYTGKLPHTGDPFFWPAVVEVDEFHDYDPLDSLLLRRYNGVVSLPTMGYEEPVELSSDLEPGDVFRCNSSRVLGLASKLGYLSRENLHVTSFGLEGFQYLRRLLTSYEPLVYEFVVLKPISYIFV
jgi:hypothetical protein